jgi:hypothetical protein
MDRVHKGLVIREPWIDLLLSGKKSWEMRGQRPSYRGWIGLIRKGSGRVSGIARLVDVGYPLSPEEMVAAFDKHRIPESMIRSGEVSKWTTPWKLSGIRVLREPVPYRHPNGAITLFSLDPEVSTTILAQLGEGPALSPAAAQQVAPQPSQSGAGIDTRSLAKAQSSVCPNTLLGEAEVTAGNLKNDHFYLRSFLHRFPSDLVGGRDQTPQVLAQVEADGMPFTTTDICPRHRFFRDRSWTRAFLANRDVEPGDTVQVHELAPYRYKVSLKKIGRT